jgi:hypothetical protein
MACCHFFKKFIFFPLKYSNNLYFCPMKFKKVILCCIFGLFLLHKADAQPRRYVARTFYWDLVSFQHAIGFGIYGGTNGSNWCAQYSPRANLIMLGTNSISLGTHLGLGLSGKGTQGLKLVYDIPFVFDFNFGHNALSDNIQKGGGFLGFGYGFNQIRDEAGQFRSQGLVFNAGGRGLIFERSLTLRVSYLLPLRKSFESIFSVGLQYNLQ